MGQPLVLHFALHGPDQVGDLFVVRRIQLDRGDAVDVVEQDAVTAHLLVVGLDAEEVRVELNHEATHGSLRNEADGLIGNEKQERAGPERVTAEVGPEGSVSLLNPVHGEVIEPPWPGRGPGEIVALFQWLNLQRDVAVARVEQFERRVCHRSTPPPALRGRFTFWLELSVAEALDQVVVDHADGLHEGVADRGADELEAPTLQVFAHGV